MVNKNEIIVQKRAWIVMRARMTQIQENIRESGAFGLAKSITKARRPRPAGNLMTNCAHLDNFVIGQFSLNSGHARQFAMIETIVVKHVKTSEAFCHCITLRVIWGPKIGCSGGWHGMGRTNENWERRTLQLDQTRAARVWSTLQQRREFP